MDFRHLGVPYFSQFSDREFAVRIIEEGRDPCEDPSWRATGFDTPEQYRFWSRRICGLACLRSILHYWRIDQPSPAELLQSALASGSYILHPDGRVDGLLYAPFAAWVAQSFGLAVEVLGKHPLESLTCQVDMNTFGVASVSDEIRHAHLPSTRQGGHLVLITGAAQDRLWFHNPSGGHGAQQDVCIASSRFSGFHAQRGMLIRRSQFSFPK